MNTYLIVNMKSGHVFGRYEGNTPDEALDAMAQEAGHASYADLQEEVPAAPGEVKVTEVSMVSLNGSTVDFDDAVQLMDDEIREELHFELAPCTDQAFLDAYAECHAAKFGQAFVVN